MATVLYLDDLRVGQRFAAGPHVMDPERIKAFAQEFDPQAFHIDEAAARESPFKALAASGWHTAAVAIKLMVASPLRFAAGFTSTGEVVPGLIGFGGELSWPRPTRPGDVLTLDAEVLEITPSRSKPQQGVVTVRATVVNQAGEPVYIFTGKVLCFRRPGAQERIVSD
jgi:acyl dehydratase